MHGGQSVVAGASIYLFAANNNGYGNLAKSLLNSTTGNPVDGNGNYYVTTASDGSFSITSDYTCPSTTSQLYLYSAGGNPGGSSANSAIGLLAALGTCPANGTLSSFLFIVINEVSTIATAYSIAGYTIDPLHVSSPNTALAQTGIANAFATVTNLETLNTGTSLATTPAANGGNGTVPQSEIDTLANILAACVNSSGPSSTPCTTLFSNAKNGAIAPTDTATAAINIAHNPGANITALYGLQTGITEFQPMLSGQPNDFIVGIHYTGGGLSGPADVAIDASDNIWVVNNGGNNSISEFSPVGKPANSTGFTGGGLNLPVGIAIDGSANVWVTNYGLNLTTDANAPGTSVSEFNSSGTPINSTGITGGGIAAPLGIAIDKSGNVWIANDNNRCISELDPSGTAKSSASGYTGGGLAGATGIAIDTSGEVWVTDNDVAGLSKFDSSGTPVSANGYTGGGLGLADGVAIDASGNVWTTSTEAATISEFNSGGTPVSSTGFTGHGLSEPYGIAIDASGNVWVANAAGNSVTELNSSGTAISGASGYSDGGINTPVFPAVDGSGNVWVSNNGSNSITEFVGAATPVVTPIVANLITPYGTAAVNKP